MTVFPAHFTEALLTTATPPLLNRSLALKAMATGTGIPGTGTYVAILSSAGAVLNATGDVTTDANGGLDFYSIPPGSGGIDIYQGSTLLRADIRGVRDARVTFLSGLLAARPAASATAVDQLYFASDDNGGTQYRSDGVSAWTQISGSVTGGAKGTVITGANTTGTATATGSVISTLVDVPSTGITVPANTTGDIWLEYAGDFLDGPTSGKGLLLLIETTSGSVTRSSVVANVVGADSSVGSFPQKSWNLGAMGASARTFKLQIEFITTGAQFSMLNSTTNPTYLTAVSR